MFVSDRYRFIIATPTKTGTLSLDHLVRNVRGEDYALWKDTKRRPAQLHSLAPPPGREDYVRIMTIRHPDDRLVSMYEFLRKERGEYLYKELQENDDWLWFLRRIASVRRDPHYHDGGSRGIHGGRPFRWTDNLSECVHYCLYGKDVDGSYLPWGEARLGGLIRLERFQEDWRDRMMELGADELADLELPHLNKKGRSRSDYWSTPEARYLGDEINCRSAEMLGYQPMKNEGGENMTTSTVRAEAAKRDGAVLDLLQKSGPLTRSAIKEQLGLERGVYSSLIRLRDDDLVVCEGERRSAVWKAVATKKKK